MPSTLSDPSTSGFQYYLHVWRDEPETGASRLAELLATDGKQVRSLRSRGSILTFEEVEALDVATDIVRTIEGEWQPDAPFFGYESLSDTEMVAILHDAGRVDEQWAVFPCEDRQFSPGHVVEPAVTANDGTRHHLIAGAEVVWRSARPHLEGAIEARSGKQRDVEDALRLLDHIEAWELRATAECDGEIQEVSLAAERARTVEPEAPAGGRLEAEFSLDQVILQTFAGRPSFQAWFVLQFDLGAFCVPDNWRRFWIAVDPGGSGRSG